MTDDMNTILTPLKKEGKKQDQLQAVPVSQLFSNSLKIIIFSKEKVKNINFRLFKYRVLNFSKKMFIEIP